MKKYVLMIGFLLATSAAGQAADGPVVARMGDKAFTQEDFTRWLSYSGGKGERMAGISHEQKDAMLRSIVTGMAIADQAKAEGFDQRPDISENLQLIVNNFLTVQYLDKVVAARVEVSDEEVKRYYEEHKKGMTMPEQVHARHILVKVARTDPDAERAKAWEKAAGLLRRVKAGENFAALAGEFSDDPGSKTKGGDLGFFPTGIMAPEFETAAFALPPGGVSDLVETDFGFHIIRVEEKKAPAPPPFEQEKDGLRKRVTIEKKGKMVDEYVKKLINEKKITFDSAPLFGGAPHGK